MTSFRNVFCWLCFVVVVDARLTQDAVALEASNSDPRIDILRSIVGQFGYPESAKSWKGNADPCEWFGIICKEDTIMRTAFMSMNLTGTISSRFAELTSLTVIDLSHNHLTGTIPFELTNLKNLTILDVSYNELHGKVPNVKGMVIDTEENPNIETNRVPSSTSNNIISTNVFALFGIAVGLILVAGGALKIIRNVSCYCTC